MENIIIAGMGSAVTLLLGLLVHYREIKKLTKSKNEEIKEHQLKADVLDRVLDFASFNEIKTAVDELFKTTRADRFLILIAINGKVDFNMVSVIFEQHKIGKYQINAIARYKTLNIDPAYKKMLKEAELYGIVETVTSELPPSLLKDIYEIEDISASHVRHLSRIHVDESNDVLVYSSLATHDKRGFTHIDKVRADLVYNSIIRPALENVLDFKYDKE